MKFIFFSGLLLLVMIDLALILVIITSSCVSYPKYFVELITFVNTVIVPISILFTCLATLKLFLHWRNTKNFSTIKKTSYVILSLGFSSLIFSGVVNLSVDSPERCIYPTDDLVISDSKVNSAR
jgi:hypothetical protein